MHGQREQVRDFGLGRRTKDLDRSLRDTHGLVGVEVGGDVCEDIANQLKRAAGALGATELALAATALGVVCTGVALIIYFRLIKTLGSMGVASQSYLRAGFSVLLGLLILGEQPTAPVLAGLALTITGVALEEMTHLCLVGNLMSALGAQPVIAAAADANRASDWRDIGGFAPQIDVMQFRHRYADMHMFAS